MWEFASGQDVRMFEGNTSDVTAVAVTPDGKHIVSGSHDKTLKVWDLASGCEVRTLRGHTESVSAVAVTPDGKHIVSGSHDNTLKVWELASGKCLASFQADGPIYACAISSDGKTLVAGDALGRLHFLRFEEF
jgi:WD40 repeat protein